jgi:hypothetical protein
MPRTIQERIQELESKIAAIKARDERKQARANPAVKHMSQALKSIDKSLNATDDNALRGALDEARATVASCLGLCGVKPKEAKGATHARKRKAKPAGGKLTPETVLAFVEAHPGFGSEQITAALGTDAITLRPLMQALIDDEKVATEGERRGRKYFPAEALAATGTGK